MDDPEKFERNSSVQPRVKTARISRNQSGEGFQPAAARQDAWNLFSVVELVALRRVAPRSAAQELPASRAVTASRSAAARACAAEATGLSKLSGYKPVDELLRADAASAPRRRGGVVAARQPLPLNKYDACPTLQTLFDVGANNGLTRRCFLGVVVCVAAFLSGCVTANRNDAIRKGAARPEVRITELKLALPPPTQPSATLRPAFTVGNLIFVSGHISRAADGKLITGRVGEDLDVAAGKTAARQCGLAILSTLRNELGSLDRVKRVVKVLGLVNCPAGFRDQPAVINGCSELFRDVFGKENGLGEQGAVGMGSLRSGVAVEIEAIFEIE